MTCMFCVCGAEKMVARASLLRYSAQEIEVRQLERLRMTNQLRFGGASIATEGAQLLHG